MVPDRIIYTDGHDVTVTESQLKVRQHEYRLAGITKHGLMVLPAQRLPGILLLLLGVAAIFCGLMNLFPQSVEIGDSFVTGNTIAIWSGVVLAFIGLVLALVIREKYAVRIATAEGEKNAVVSSKKEYISQIVDALNKAYSHYRDNPPLTTTRTV